MAGELTMNNASFEKALYGKVKRKANTAGNINLRGKLNKVLSKKPEVMVKITGFSKGGGAVKANLDYITRNGKVELEDSKGNTYLGKESVKEFFNNWDDFDQQRKNKNQRDTMKMVLSMPAGTDAEALKKAARDFVKKEFSVNHEYAFALHTDDKHPHVHLVVKTLGFDQKRLNPRKADIQHWRESFAEKLNDRGIDAVATPRAIRGKVKKSEAQILRHIEQEEAKRKPRVSTVLDAQRKEALSEVKAERNGDKTQPNAWDSAIKKQQKEVIKNWHDLADELQKQPDQDDKILAKKIRIFADNLPDVKTRREELKDEIKKTSQPER
jgi:type IV secretory pathway VirD2 relaxase